MSSGPISWTASYHHIISRSCASLHLLLDHYTGLNASHQLPKRPSWPICIHKLPLKLSQLDLSLCFPWLLLTWFWIGSFHFIHFNWVFCCWSCIARWDMSFTLGNCLAQSMVTSVVLLGSPMRTVRMIVCTRGNQHVKVLNETNGQEPK